MILGRASVQYSVKLLLGKLRIVFLVICTVIVLVMVFIRIPNWNQYSGMVVRAESISFE